MNIKRIASVLTGSFLVAAAIPAVVSAAASTVVVTPTNQQGWSTADTRANGHVTFVGDADAPLGTGALQLQTDATPVPGQDKAQYLHAANVPLSDVDTLSYYTKQVAGPAGIADPSYQLLVDLNGDAPGGFTTFVYEPYQNGTVTSGDWQQWDVAGGQFWSSRSFTDGADCTVQAGAGGTYFYTLAGLQADCPDAVATGFGVNVGSNNPGYTVLTDAVVFNDTTYDFEVKPYVATTKDECKNGGWQDFQTTYKNQGDCVSAVASNGKAKGNPEKDTSVVATIANALSRFF